MKILVAMSGGVDSAVAAYLLKKQGHDVVGMTMRVHDDPERKAKAKSCCAPKDIGDAREVALELGIPYYAVDLRQEFQDQVIRPFAQDYRDGRTPNPCVRCNSEFKFGLLYQRAKALGLDGVATGHYAKVERTPEGVYRLLRAADGQKDQSYFLFGLTQDQLAHTFFPLGELTKAQVREVAREAGLPVADKVESQEICFVADNDYAKVVATTFPELSQGAEGDIVDGEGNRVGSHAGVHHFTVGQRRGLGVSHPRPLYVVGIDAKDKQVTVGERGDLLRREMEVDAVHWLAPHWNGEGEFSCDVSIRYRHKAAAARLLKTADPRRVRVVFVAEQRAIAPGQAAVFYHHDEILGGGWIAA